MSVPVDDMALRVQETTLVERARHGDRDAFGQLVQRYAGDAIRLASFITGSGVDAEDVTQEAFIKAFRGLNRFRDDRALRPWLLRIVANEAKNNLRAAGRRARRERLAGWDRSLMAPVVGSGPDPLVAGVDSPALLDALASLGDRDRQVIAYRYFAGLGEAEMAVALGCAPGTVKSRLARALGRLRAELERVTNG